MHSRQIAVDTDGRLLTINLMPADIADSTRAQLVLDGGWYGAGRGANTCSMQRTTVANRWTRLGSWSSRCGSRTAAGKPARLRGSTLGRRTYLRLADALPATGT